MRFGVLAVICEKGGKGQRRGSGNGSSEWVGRDLTSLIRYDSVLYLSRTSSESGPPLYLHQFTAQGQGLLAHSLQRPQRVFGEFLPGS